MSLVSFVKVDEISAAREALRRALALIQFQLKREIKTVVIKPNMCFYWDYTTGETTNPRVVASLIELLREQLSSNVRITIVESDASAMKCEYAFKILGYEKMAESLQVELLNLSKDESEFEEVEAGGFKFNFGVPKTIRRADLRINVPKIKYGGDVTKITCALKNIFGCNPYPRKYVYHKNLNEAIVALNKLMKFDLCIVDGLVVSGVRPLKLGLLMASIDPVAVDAAAAKILRINPRSIKHLRLACEEKLGTISYKSKGIDPVCFARSYPYRDGRYVARALLFNALRKTLSV